MPEWGGTRPGAGRKPKQPGKTRVSLSTRISERSSEQLRAYAKTANKPLGEVLDEMVLFVGEQPGFAERVVAPAEPVGPASGPWTQAFVDLLPGGVAVVDGTLTVRLANPAFLAVAGPLAVIIGRPLDEVLGGDTVALREAGRLAWSDGLVRTALYGGGEVRICPMRDAAGGPLGLAVFLASADGAG